ncbi:unnamed protein product [Ectocarpus fasciculatus]
MGSGATNYQYRKVLNRENADTMKVIYDIPKAKYVPGCCQKICTFSCCECSCCKCSCCPSCTLDCGKVGENARMAARESNYTWVMENRMELNRAYAVPKEQLFDLLCCRYQVLDSTQVRHFDHDMFDYITVKKTKGCWLWCCGTPGDIIVFKTACCLCPTARYCGVEKGRICVNTGDGNDVAQMIKTARDNARAKMG